MKTVTISEAKAKLSALVEAAAKGEEVLIMRGSKPAATLVPVSEADLALWPAIPQRALLAFGREVAAERRRGALRNLGKDAAAAARALRALGRDRAF